MRHREQRLLRHVEGPVGPAETVIGKWAKLISAIGVTATDIGRSDLQYGYAIDRDVEIVRRRDAVGAVP